MLAYIGRRLLWAAFTIFGVMILTFLLFRVGAGDIASANLGQQASNRQKAQWRHRHGYDLPWMINLSRRLIIIDRTSGSSPLDISDNTSGQSVQALSLILDMPDAEPKGHAPVLMSGYVRGLKESTPITELTLDQQLAPPLKDPHEPAQIIFKLADGSSLVVDVENVATIGDLMKRINTHQDNNHKVEARITDLSFTHLFHSQFFRHLETTLLFQGRSFTDGRSLTEIISRHAPYSLAIQVPAMAFQWFIGMILACFVAYYRGTMIDKVGVFLSVLGMCIPFLAFMIYGQSLVFALGMPEHAFGTIYRGNLYVPIAIMVVASLGGHVRFYRTIILDETSRDYVRTAKAKGLGLNTILFKHVLKNCMLPILTSLILSIPFLIMGSLLVENFFGIPGLGDRMITSINSRDEPIMNGLVFLTAVIYTIGILLTDLCYAIFDPRIRLK